MTPACDVDIARDRVATQKTVGGLADMDELRYFTNLFLPDSDGDGVRDGQEINNGTNPLNIFDK